MAVMHVLRDGTVTKDITDHVVTMEQARAVYALMDEINRKEKKDEK